MILLLVEDEEYTRNGIVKSINWPELGIEKVYTAEDGLEGIEVARSCHPDIVLADIRMPRVSGLEMAKEIRELSPHCALVFISGYSDKDYLKSALHLSALDYVFKPLDLNELNDTLVKAINHVKQNSEDRAVISTLKHQELTTLLIQDETNNDDLLRLWKQYDLPLDKNLLYRTILVKQKYNRNTILLIKKVAQQFGIHILIGRIDSFYLLHVMISTKQNHLLDDFIDKLSKHIFKGKETTIAVGIPVYSPLEIRESFTSARAARHRQFYHSDCHLFMGEEYAPSLDILYNPSHEFKRLLLKSTKKARQWLIEQFEYIRHYDGTPVEVIQNWAFQITMELYLYDYRSVDRTLNSPTNKATLWDTITSMISLDEVKVFLLSIMDNLLNCYSDNQAYPFAVLESKRFIHLNYSNPFLTLKDISQHVNISSTYLCRIFKESTNQTINQYLTNYRIHQAQSLLKSTNMRIYEIARASGYFDSSYFIKTFRKATGITPQEYRERHLII